MDTEESHDKIMKEIAHIKMLIQGDPPKTKGIFQRLDDANGKLSRHEKFFNGIWGGCGTVAIGIVIFILQRSLGG